MWRLLVAFFSLPVLLAETAMFPQREDVTGWVVLNVLAYAPIVFASVVFHECGHAVAARFLGLRVLRIEVGSGRRIARWKWGTTRFVVHAYPPMRGKTYFTTGARWRIWFAILAGPMVNFGVLIVALHVLDARVRDVMWPRYEMVTGPAFLELVAFHSVWALFWNLLPFSLVGGTSDGSQLLTVPFRKDKNPAEAAVVPECLEIGELHEDGELDAAWLRLQPLLATNPRSILVRFLEATLLMSREDFEGARARLLELLGEFPPEGTAAVQNNLAWVAYLAQNDELKAEADKHSAAALKTDRTKASYMGTRGAVLAWLGRHDEALELIQRAHLLSKTPSGRASNECNFAIIYAREDKIELASEWLVRAQKSDPKNQLLGRAKTAIADAKGRGQRGEIARPIAPPM